MRKFVSRPPTVAEAIQILSWPSNTREYRQQCLALWASMGADTEQIKAKFMATWKKKNGNAG